MLASGNYHHLLLLLLYIIISRCWHVIGNLAYVLSDVCCSSDCVNGLCTLQSVYENHVGATNIFKHMEEVHWFCIHRGGFINLCFVNNSSKNGYLRSRGMNMGIRQWICVLWFCHQLLEIRATSFLWNYGHINLCHVPNPTHHSASHKLVSETTNIVWLNDVLYPSSPVYMTRPTTVLLSSWTGLFLHRHEDRQNCEPKKTLQQQHVW